MFERADALLLGRKTWEIWEPYWPHHDGGDPVSHGINVLPKYVPSTTLKDPTWQNTHVIDGDVEAAIRELKAKPGREIQVHGSGELLRWLLERDLVDELNLRIYPVVVGEGTAALPGARPDARADAGRVADDAVRHDAPDVSAGRAGDLRDRRGVTQRLDARVIERRRSARMTKIIAAITMSVDGYITGPDDGPDKGLGEGGERLHYWVMGGPWSYENEPQGEPEGEDAEYLNEMTARGGAIVVGRNMYEAAGHWGDKNPFGMPVFVVTHRPEEEPETGEFTFVGGFEEAIDRAKEAAGDKDVSIGGGADVIRQGLDAGIVDELHIIVAPVILGGGKHLFEDFTKSLDLENRGVRQSRWATFIEFAVKR